MGACEWNSTDSDFVTWQGLQEALEEAINSLPPMLITGDPVGFRSVGHFHHVSTENCKSAGVDLADKIDSLVKTRFEEVPAI